MDNEPGAPPPEVTTDEETIHPQMINLPCTSNRSKMKGCRQVVEVENAGGKTYDKTCGLYNKYRKYLQQWT
jgi:hypothetical protein